MTTPTQPRRFIIDTDTASDDAVALRAPNVEVAALPMMPGKV